MINVGFWFDAPHTYNGGLNYLANLLHAISVVDESRIRVRPYVFFATDVPEEIIARFSCLATVIKTKILTRKTAAWLIHKLLYKTSGSMALVNFKMEQHGIDVLSHAWFPYTGRRNVKVIAWIPDFQYMHMPEMFPDLNKENEDNTNRNIAKCSDAVIVSSDCARRDLSSIISNDKEPEIAVLRFVAQPSETSIKNESNLKDMEAKYGFTGDFFVLPNQFWAHKNHEVVIRAILHAKREGLEMKVLMTGNPKDYRLKGTPYIDSLRDLVKNHDLEANVMILGHINYSDLICLMKNSIAIINPSRFEGWSSSVEEAKSLGKSILLSNIPVHIEQAPELGTYFEWDDHLSLMRIMADHLRGHNQEKMVEDGLNQKEQNLQRTKIFGKKYIEIIEKVYNI